MSLLTPAALLPASSVLKIKLFLCATLGFQTYDWYRDLPFELKHIWREPSSSTIKWGYIWSRYLSIVLQLIYSIFWTSTLSFASVPVTWCQFFHGFVSIMWETLLLCFGLMLRKHALPLYGNRPRVSTILNILAFLEIVAGPAWTFSVGQRMGMAGACMVKTLPNDIIYYSIMRILFHGLFWIFACITPEETQPMTRRHIIDNISPGFTAIFALFMGILSSANVTNFSDVNQIQFSHFTPCISSLVVVMTGLINCRLIKKIEYTRARLEGRTNDGSTELEVLGP